MNKMNRMNKLGNKPGAAGSGVAEGGGSRLMQYFILHRNIAIVSLLLLFFADWIVDGSGWFFWLALSWIMALVIHFCIVKSIMVDEDWADERARDLRIKSYDYKHIHAIRDRYIKPRRAKSPGAEKRPAK